MGGNRKGMGESSGYPQFVFPCFSWVAGGVSLVKGRAALYNSGALKAGLTDIRLAAVPGR